MTTSACTTARARQLEILAPEERVHAIAASGIHVADQPVGSTAPTDISLICRDSAEAVEASDDDTAGGAEGTIDMKRVQTTSLGRKGRPPPTLFDGTHHALPLDQPRASLKQFVGINPSYWHTAVLCRKFNIKAHSTHPHARTHCRPQAKIFAKSPKKRECAAVHRRSGRAE